MPDRINLTDMLRGLGVPDSQIPETPKEIRDILPDEQGKDKEEEVKESDDDLDEFERLFKAPPSKAPEPAEEKQVKKQKAPKRGKGALSVKVVGGGLDGALGDCNGIKHELEDPEASQ